MSQTAQDLFARKRDVCLKESERIKQRDNVGCER